MVRTDLGAQSIVRAAAQDKGPLAFRHSALVLRRRWLVASTILSPPDNLLQLVGEIFGDRLVGRRHDVLAHPAQDAAVALHQRLDCDSSSIAACRSRGPTKLEAGTPRRKNVLLWPCAASTSIGCRTETARRAWPLQWQQIRHWPSESEHPPTAAAAAVLPRFPSAFWVTRHKAHPPPAIIAMPMARPTSAVASRKTLVAWRNSTRQRWWRWKRGLAYPDDGLDRRQFATAAFFERHWLIPS